MLTIFSLVHVVLLAEATALKFSATLKRPTPEDLSGPQDHSGRDLDSDPAGMDPEA